MRMLPIPSEEGETPFRLTTKYDMFSTMASVGMPKEVNISIPFRVSSVANLDGVVTSTW